MPRGHEDWGVSATAVQAAPDLPGAEIAARLGALSLYDQTGQLLYADGFEEGLAPWSAFAGGAGAATTVIAGRSFLGGYSVRLTGGSNAEQQASLAKNLPRPFLSSWGIESRATLQSAGGEWLMDIRFYDATDEYRYEVRVNMASRDVSVLVAGGGYVTVGTALSFNQGPDIWHPMKLVVDLVARAYKRLVFGPFQIDLSAYTPRVQASASRGYIAVTVACISRAGLNDFLDVDSVIVTQNEP